MRDGEGGEERSDRSTGMEQTRLKQKKAVIGRVRILEVPRPKEENCHLVGYGFWKYPDQNREINDWSGTGGKEVPTKVEKT